MQTIQSDSGLGTMPFSQQIREATDAAHQAAERSEFVSELVDGRLPLGEYVRLLTQLRAIYGALEHAAAANDDPIAARFLHPELARVPSIDADLNTLAELTGEESRAARGPHAPAVLNSTEEYCDRLRNVCVEWPGGLVAHHYVRYLGDLSGGQFLGRVIARVYDLPDGAGTKMYRFAEIDSPKRFKDDYRDQLDAVPWDATERALVVDEANRAFAFNTAIFSELTRTRLS
ncbi:MAG: biliverdin-producing heme oxygenase [Acidimicrobiia bacterium]